MRITTTLFSLIVFSMLGNSVCVAEEISVKHDTAGFDYYAKKQPSFSGSKEYLVIIKTERTGKAFRFGVAKEFVDENVALINKFLKWADIARAKHDTLTKEIGTVVGFDEGLANMYNKYGFTTNGSAYLLAVVPGHSIFGSFTPTSVDDPSTAKDTNFSEHTVVLNEHEAKAVIKVLLAYKEGKVVNVNENDYQ